MINENLEAAIDLAGREKVFAYVRANGWTSQMAVPVWVWQQAVYEVANEPD